MPCVSALVQKQTCAAQKRHVRFTPNSDRESEIPQKAMFALAPKADIGQRSDLINFKSAIVSFDRAPCL
jgi:hypothetical protein